MFDQCLRNIYSHFALGLGVYIIGGKPVRSSPRTTGAEGDFGRPFFGDVFGHFIVGLQCELSGFPMFPLTLPRLTLPTCFQNSATCAMPGNPGREVSEPHWPCFV